MKIMVKTVQIFVGILFIISGLVKANDPLGLSYKMQEFFELWSSSLGAGNNFFKDALLSLFGFLHNHSVFLSVFIITLEIGAGIALLIGWMKNFVVTLLLLLILFFTFLTGYAYLSGRFTNCGCFGDCLPISPLASFIKDLVLLVLIIILLAGKKLIAPVATPRLRSVMLGIGIIAAVALQIYVLNYLPVIDCLPFKKGKNITQQMQPPPGAVTDSFAIRFIYEKNGKKFEFAPEDLPADFDTYTYVDRKDKLVRKGNAEPAIKGFSLTNASGDETELVLQQPRAILVFAIDVAKEPWLLQLKQLSVAAAQKGVPVYLASPSAEKAAQALQNNGIGSVSSFNCDFTVVRTAARTNPTIYFLQHGTIKNKLSAHNFKSAEEYAARQF